MIQKFESDGCKGTAQYSISDYKATIAGQLENPTTGQVKPNFKFHYLAASPPDTRYSRAGSGLPFPNKDIAFSNTPNQGTVVTDASGRFQFEIEIPNQYHINGGTDLQPPTVFMIDDEQENIYSVILEKATIRDRSLTNLMGRPRRTTGR